MRISPETREGGSDGAERQPVSQRVGIEELAEAVGDARNYAVIKYALVMTLGQSDRKSYSLVSWLAQVANAWQEGQRDERVDPAQHLKAQETSILAQLNKVEWVDKPIGSEYDSLRIWFRRQIPDGGVEDRYYLVDPSGKGENCYEADIVGQLTLTF